MTKSLVEQKGEDPASIEDIELFDKTDSQDRPVTIEATVTDADWTVEEAAKELSKSPRTIRRLLKEKQLEGYKVKGRRRAEWRIKPVKVAERESVTVHVNKENSKENDRLWSLVNEQSAKIEALTMRNGYLQAQVETTKETIKLLEDHSRMPWYRRAWGWFTGTSGT